MKLIFISIVVLIMAACSPQVVHEAENVPDFKSFNDVKAKKNAFFNFLYPAVIEENARIAEERDFLTALMVTLDNGNSLSSRETVKAAKLGIAYKTSLTEKSVTKDWLSTMLVKVDFIPAPLVLSQAANESAWGTSRFAREANNYFGQWCYTTGCGVIPNKRSQGATHEVAKFNTSKQAVNAYFMNVNRNNAYKELRRIRAGLHTVSAALTPEQEAIELAKGLIRYSERGEHYVEEIQAMIRHNHQYWR